MVNGNKRLGLHRIGAEKSGLGFLHQFFLRKKLFLNWRKIMGSYLGQKTFYAKKLVYAKSGFGQTNLAELVCKIKFFGEKKFWRKKCVKKFGVKKSRHKKCSQYFSMRSIPHNIFHTLFVTIP